MRSLLLVMLACTALAFAANGPSLHIDREVQLAAQTKGQPVKTTIAFTNSGDAPLTIAEVETPCGCTKAKLDRAQLAPGESGNIEVAIDTTRLSGTYDKTLKIRSNDATAPTRNLRIRFDLAEATSP